MSFSYFNFLHVSETYCGSGCFTQMCSNFLFLIYLTHLILKKSLLVVHVASILSLLFHIPYTSMSLKIRKLSFAWVHSKTMSLFQRPSFIFVSWFMVQPHFVANLITLGSCATNTCHYARISWCWNSILCRKAILRPECFWCSDKCHCNTDTFYLFCVCGALQFFVHHPHHGWQCYFGQLVF